LSEINGYIGRRMDTQGYLVWKAYGLHNGNIHLRICSPVVTRGIFARAKKERTIWTAKTNKNDNLLSRKCMPAYRSTAYKTNNVLKTV